MYIISIYVKNTETGNEDFSLIGRDFLPMGHQDYIARVFETKEEAIDYLKSISYIVSGVHGNDWVYQNEKLPEIESRCRIWKVGE
ncbi:TPA: hypothetical protein VU805_001606 [Streptococcus pneumoniae]|nr:hypothetical protein [Streptococcus pneumoniae]HET5494796.1 hypothetical protein [Streptococcus pneumoniae]HET5866750.1 hypothetical protein [Streptococcus pneumoniae]HET5872923.1 hypothetical protein [Streptococcus pneumoniae]HET7908383.1 hypothetical protein [Streptococcus pneumoniae]